ncbi:methyltransferase domain-containing protein [Amycolatopsis rhabdoformis]|uniref:Methyltransferase domain-containing protein n=1 Tax=Amycolatopsis rhabdoformis TaxID=1448059 RepID=A0ABZ1IJI2_9PSEU|nr:methyltransferase domain-containing protein [Amycolatopsis rhabdoformis]WSE34127.1 methyltransferase domain-containing protein [Amycolatopsis rhabdoformis]
MITSPGYALTNAWERAQRRLAGLEQTYDPTTRKRLSALGLAGGWRCLEVGAGAGSIARWLGEQAGPDGSVCAVDLEVTALHDLPANVEVRQADIRSDPLPEAAFDVVHARLLLNHLSEREAVLDRLVAALRPGGWLLLEEGDTFSIGAIDEDTDHARAMRAWCEVLATVADVDFGRKLPALVVSRGLTDVGVECEVPYAEGGTLGTEWLALTFDQLNERAGGQILDAATVERWKDKLAEPGQWFPSLSLVAVRGRRP